MLAPRGPLAVRVAVGDALAAGAEAARGPPTAAPAMVEKEAPHALAVLIVRAVLVFEHIQKRPAELHAKRRGSVVLRAAHKGGETRKDLRHLRGQIVPCGRSNVLFRPSNVGL